MNLKSILSGAIALACMGLAMFVTTMPVSASSDTYVLDLLDSASIAGAVAASPDSLLIGPSPSQLDAKIVDVSMSMPGPDDAGDDPVPGDDSGGGSDDGDPQDAESIVPFLDFRSLFLRI